MNAFKITWCVRYKYVEHHFIENSAPHPHTYTFLLHFISSISHLPVSPQSQRVENDFHKRVAAQNHSVDVNNLIKSEKGF